MRDDPRLQCAYFLVPGNPIPKQGVMSGKGRFYVKPKVKRHQDIITAYSIELLSQLRQHVGWDKSADVAIFLRFYRANKRVCDVDNLCKCFFDGIKRVLIEDDKQIVKAVASKHYDLNRPRTFAAIVYGMDQDGAELEFEKLLGGMNEREERARKALAVGRV